MENGRGGKGEVRGKNGGRTGAGTWQGLAVSELLKAA